MGSETSTTTDILVSIIVPCRNEEHNVDRLLQSLATLHDVPYEILLVDDGSTDRTVERARAFSSVKVISAGEKPEGWIGKSWACWQGAQQARGDLFLFTDADTEHAPDSLARALTYLIRSGAELISAPPVHRAERGFERLLGLLHILPLIATAYRSHPRANRLFAIGQYLLIRRASYTNSGGHATIRSHLVDDIELARLYVDEGSSYSVYPWPGLYRVQMYEDLKSFAKGWTRLFRLGVRYSSLLGFVETCLVLRLFVAFDTPLLWGAGLIALAWAQRDHGPFRIWSALAAPLSVVAFILLSLIGFTQMLFGMKVEWRERTYTDI